MRWFLALLIFVSLSVQAYIPGEHDEIVKLKGECKKDSDCVLFEDECGYLTSVLRKNLGEQQVVRYSESGLEIYEMKDGPRCTVNFLVAPRWPKNPTAKCIKSSCKVSDAPSP